MSKIRAAIQGGTGYTALETLKLLVRHPNVAITAVTSREPEGRKTSDVHPQLRGRVDLPLENLSEEELAERADCVFSCLPHGVTASSVPKLLASGAKVVDLSADYRLLDDASYQTWYGHPHQDAARLGETPYGLPELFRQQLRGAALVANPGCYPTSALLPLAPLLQSDLIESSGLIVDSKSGVSGAGRNPSMATHFPECNESVAAYNLGKHRHQPEIEQTLKRLAVNADVIFTPHLMPMDRGILSTIYVTPKSGVSEKRVLDCWRDRYQGEPFVRIVNTAPNTKQVQHTNYCDMAVFASKGKLILVSVIDNLIKGAAGAAVQNMNVIFGIEETLGLL